MSGTTNESFVQLPPNSTGVMVDGFLVDVSGTLSQQFRQTVVIGDAQDANNVAYVDGQSRLAVHPNDLGFLDLVAEDLANTDGQGAPGLLKQPFSSTDGSEPSLVVQVSPNTPLIIDQSQATVIGGVGPDGANRRMKIGTDGGLQLSDSILAGPFVASAIGQICVLDTTGYQSIVLQASGTFTATVLTSQGHDGQNWSQVLGVSTSASNVTTLSTGLTGPGLITFPVVGRYFKVAIAAYTSGQVVITAVLRASSSNVQTANITALGGISLPGLNQNAVTQALPVAGSDPSTTSRALRTDISGNLTPNGMLQEGWQPGTYNVSYSKYTTVLKSGNTATVPLIIGGLDQTNAAQFLLTDGSGAALIASAPSTPAEQSIQELLMQLVALNRVQAQYLYEIRTAASGTTLPDEPDVLLADYLNPASTLSNMMN